MPPNTDDDAPPNPSGGDPNPADQGGSQGDGAPGDSKDTPPVQTLEQRAGQSLQGLMDRNTELLKSGRFTEMDPKVVGMLNTYDQLTRPPADPAPKAEPDLGLSPRSGAEDPRTKELAAEGLKSKQRELVGQIAGQVETDILRDNWAEDIKALFAEYGKDGITNEDYASIDPLDRTTFPFSRQGYRTWQTAANAFRVKQIVAKAAADAEGGGGAPQSPEDKDRAAARGTPRRPQVQSAGKGVTDLKTAAKRRSEGRGPNDAEFREQIRNTIRQAGMGSRT